MPGEIANMMLDGTLCQHCGEALVFDADDEPAGYPQSCAGCGGGEDDEGEQRHVENRQRRKARYRRRLCGRDRVTLAQEFPLLFNAPGSAEPKKPLKIGINSEIVTALKQRGIRTNHWRISYVLQDYTSGFKYAEALAAGGPRYGLDGQPAGEVAPAHQERARIYLARRSRPNERAAA